MSSSTESETVYSIDGEGASSSVETVEVHSKQWKAQSYRYQSKRVWPGRGQHVLAQYDEESIVVYQAYKEAIATYAVEHKRFTGCPSFGVGRMTWIKTNFLWMMFRSGWGSKHNQEHVLAIWLRRDAFERYLEHARRKGSVRGFQGTVRLQWDPDHVPSGEKHVYRRAVQLGLKNVTSYMDGSDILDIQDVTPFVHEQGRLAQMKVNDELVVARERVFTPRSQAAIEALDLSTPTEFQIDPDEPPTLMPFA